MRIAHVTSFFQPQYYAPNEQFICEKMAELGHDVVLFCPDTIPKWQRHMTLTRSHVRCEKHDGFTVQRVSTNSMIGGMPLMPSLLPNLIKQTFDVIHTHEYFAFCSLQSAIAARMKNLPLIITQHNDQLPDSLMNRFSYMLDSHTIGRYSLLEAKKIIALTNNTKLHLRNMGADENKIEVIPNAVDTTLYSPNCNNLLESRWGISSPVVLFVGRLVIEKEAKFLIKAFSNVSKSIQDAKLVIVGIGPEENNLRKLAKKLKIKNVFFLGQIENKLMPNIYVGCDVFVLPSLREPFGNVVIEAMSAGKPVIGTYVGGMRDTIIHGKTGYHVQPRNSRQISDSLLKVLSDETLKKKLGKNARRRAIKNYDSQVLSKRIEDLYLEARL